MFPELGERLLKRNKKTLLKSNGYFSHGVKQVKFAINGFFAMMAEKTFLVGKIGSELMMTMTTAAPVAVDN